MHEQDGVQLTEEELSLIVSALIRHAYEYNHEENVFNELVALADKVTRMGA